VKEVDMDAKPRKITVSSADLVNDAKTRISNLSIEEVQHSLAHEHALLIDIRDVRERARLGTIPRAHHVARGLLEFWADPESHHYKEFFGDDRPIILFCAGGGRSALAADVLQRMGYPMVAHLECGFDGWQQAGQPVEPVVSRTSSQPDHSGHN
jgi:rhodanese-related sulfurtransferase